MCNHVWCDMVSRMTGTAVDLGLRERKKQRTRQLIADTARRLFAERGFEQVTVAEIAREAEVAQATVFNYFPTKEDLFYSRLEAFEEELLAAIRERAPGQSVLAAFAGFLLDQRGVLAMRAPGGDDEATREIRTVTRVITASPALLARELRAIAHGADRAGRRRRPRRRRLPRDRQRPTRPPPRPDRPRARAGAGRRPGGPDPRERPSRGRARDRAARARAARLRRAGGIRVAPKDGVNVS
jgi:AcrR family transcriptional regulator